MNDVPATLYKNLQKRVVKMYCKNMYWVYELTSNGLVLFSFASMVQLSQIYSMPCHYHIKTSTLLQVFGEECIYICTTYDNKIRLLLLL